MVHLIALILIAVAAPRMAHARSTRSPAIATQGARQQAYFERRLADTALRIERYQRARIISGGQATFMQQDLARVAGGIGMILQRSAALTFEEERSYRQMLERIDARLARAEATRAPRLASSR